jgi:hypothetical protein
VAVAVAVTLAVAAAFAVCGLFAETVTVFTGFGAVDDIVAVAVAP